MIPKQTIEKELRKARMEAGITQEELADKTNLTQSSIARFERGRTGLTVKNAAKIAAALGKTLTIV